MISAGSFIDYGSYASFAPSFDSDSGQIGRESLGEVAWMKENKRRRRLAAAKKALIERQAPKALPPPSSSMNTFDELEVKKLASEFMPKEEVDALLAGLQDVELEGAVSELLVRNGLALQRLLSLQEQRLLSVKSGEVAKLEIDSEEWELG